MSWDQFLTSCPPGKKIHIIDLINKNIMVPGSSLNTPEIELHCDNIICNRIGFFKCMFFEKTKTLTFFDWTLLFLTYKCKNCEAVSKIYALKIKRDCRSSDGEAIKIGEWPPFGPSVPARVISLIGRDRELFLAGRRAESLGMGIGAYAYYRRVVENQKDQIFNEIKRVAEKVEAPKETIEKINKAMKERQFSVGVDLIKNVIPQSLLINEQHNPLILLHKSLSIGIHDKTDQECLELATSIRKVLTDLADRIGQVFKEKEGLKDAVKKLQQEKAK